MSELDIAVMMYDHFRINLKFMKTSADKEVSTCLGITDRTVRSWRKIFLSNSGSFEKCRGKYKRPDALDDEEYRDMALEWVCQNSYVKGKPNITAADFWSWVRFIRHVLFIQLLHYNHLTMYSKLHLSFI